MMILCVFVLFQTTKQERTLMKPFYDRYRLLKQLLSSVSTASITTIVSSCLSKCVFVRGTKLRFQILTQRLKEREEFSPTMTNQVNTANCLKAIVSSSGQI